MENKLFLVFIESVSMNLDEKHIYHLYFSKTPEVVWGEFWNVCPCSIVPNIKPDMATISEIYEVELDEKLSLVTDNSCFSMQDCIDRIISLGWFDDDEGKVCSDKKLMFGDHFEDVSNMLNIQMNKIWENVDSSDEMIDNLIDKIGGGDDDGMW